MTLRDITTSRRALKAGALLLFLPLHAPALELTSMRPRPELKASKDSYLRYELVEMEYKDSSLDPGKVPMLAARVLKDGKPAAALAGRELLPLAYSADSGTWKGKWPIPWQPPLGRYRAEVLSPSGGTLKVYAGPAQAWELKADLGAPSPAFAEFEITGKKPLELPRGFSVMTLEPGRATYNEFPGVDGEKPSWFRILEWARFMHADAFWHNAGTTHVWGKLSSKGFPFDPQGLVMARLFSGEARLQGLGFGAYVVSFRVEGDFEKAPYEFTTGYNASTKSLRKLRFVSFADPRRRKDLVEILRQFDSLEGATYIGMDYVRNNTGCLEFTDEFLSDMGFRLPPELAQGSQESRQLWLGELISRHNNATLDNLWDWWRAHKVATAVSEILAEAAPSKPVWAFTLGWKGGHQHGQDNHMFIDAGFSFTSPMFYELFPPEYTALVRDWRGYAPGGSYVFGQPVDSPLLWNPRGLNGPEEHYLRQIEALDQLGPLCGSMGFFWHDINRALAGGRGPDTMREWAIAGASVFSRLREASGVVPVGLEIPDDAALTPAGVSFSVKVTNLSEEDLRFVRLDGVRTSGLARYLPASLDVPALRAGESRTLTWMGEWSDKVVREKFRSTTPDIRMLAVRARFPGSEEWKRPSFAFRYVGDRSRMMGPPLPVTGPDSPRDELRP